MQLPIAVEAAGKRSLQNQIYEQIRSLILTGTLRPGQRLPSSRILSEQLSVSRNTVLITYDRLMSEGYLETRSAKETFVSPNLPEESILQNTSQSTADQTFNSAKRHRSVLFSGRSQRLAPGDRPRVEIDFFVGRPDSRSFPMRAWRRIMLHETDKPGAPLTEYGDPAGLPSLREAIAAHLGATRGIRAQPDQVIITAGIQEALNIVARLFVRPGTSVATENPCYQGLINVFGSYGAKLLPVPVDQEGLDPAYLPNRRISLVCVTPSHQFPTGYTMSLDRRLRLLDWAANHGAYIVEDDYDSDFRYDGPPLMALAGLDPHETVIYLGTFSKSIGAGLRIGYLVVPTELSSAAVAAKSILNNGHPWLEQAVLAEFIASGEFVRHLRRIRVTYKHRRNCLIAALQACFSNAVISGDRGGMHVMWQMQPEFPEAGRVESAARSRGVGIYSIGSGAAYDFDNSAFARHSLLIGYPALSEEKIRTGIERVADAIGELGVS